MLVMTAGDTTGLLNMSKVVAMLKWCLISLVLKIQLMETIFTCNSKSIFLHHVGLVPFLLCTVLIAAYFHLCMLNFCQTVVGVILNCSVMILFLLS